MYTLNVVANLQNICGSTVYLGALSVSCECLSFPYSRLSVHESKGGYSLSRGLLSFSSDGSLSDHLPFSLNSKHYALPVHPDFSGGK